jgi:hypothetical protein
LAASTAAVLAVAESAAADSAAAETDWAVAAKETEVYEVEDLEKALHMEISCLGLACTC